MRALEELSFGLSVVGGTRTCHGGEVLGKWCLLMSSGLVLSFCQHFMTIECT